MNEQETPDPTLSLAKYGCSLIIGRSGSGKSFYVKDLLQKIQKSSEGKKTHIYTINVNSREYLDIFKKRIKTITLNELKLIKEPSYVIVEDVISMNAKENALLRLLINKYCHHSFLKVFIITHSIHKNGVFSLLSFFHYVVFTGAISNLPILRVTLNYFKLEQIESQTIINTFKNLAATKDHLYFVFDEKKIVLLFI